MNDRKRISGLWYLGALFVALIGWNVGVAVAGGAWNAVRDAPITSANQALDARGSSVAVFTDVLQVDLAIACRWSTTSSGAHRMPPAPVPLTVDDDGLTWQLIAFEPKGRNDMTVRCKPTRGRTDNAQYAYAVVDGFTSRANIGNLITLGSLLLGVGAAIAIYLQRRRGRMAP